MLTIITFSCAFMWATSAFVQTSGDDDVSTAGSGRAMTLQTPDAIDKSAQNVSLTAITDEEAQKLLEKKVGKEELSTPPKDITPPKLALKDAGFTADEGSRLDAIVDERMRKKKETWVDAVKGMIHTIFYQPGK